MVFDRHGDQVMSLPQVSAGQPCAHGESWLTCGKMMLDTMHACDACKASQGQWCHLGSLHMAHRKGHPCCSYDGRRTLDSTDGCSAMLRQRAETPTAGKRHDGNGMHHAACTCTRRTLILAGTTQRPRHAVGSVPSNRGSHALSCAPTQSSPTLHLHSHRSIAISSLSNKASRNERMLMVDVFALEMALV